QKASMIGAGREAIYVNANHAIEKGSRLARCDFGQIEMTHRGKIGSGSPVLVKNSDGGRDDALCCDILPVPVRNTKKHVHRQLFTITVFRRANGIGPTLLNALN